MVGVGGYYWGHLEVVRDWRWDALKDQLLSEVQRQEWSECVKKETAFNDIFSSQVSPKALCTNKAILTFQPREGLSVGPTRYRFLWGFQHQGGAGVMSQFGLVVFIYSLFNLLLLCVMFWGKSRMLHRCNLNTRSPHFIFQKENKKNTSWEHKDSRGFLKELAARPQMHSWARDFRKDAIPRVLQVDLKRSGSRCWQRLINSCVHLTGARLSWNRLNGCRSMKTFIGSNTEWYQKKKKKKIQNPSDKEAKN